VQTTLINRTCIKGELAKAKEMLVQTHGRPILRAVLHGIAGVAPRSAVPNLIDVLSTMLTRFLQECRVWIPEVLVDVGDCR
jgi:hypothetical protein